MPARKQEARSGGRRRPNTRASAAAGSGPWPGPSATYAASPANAGSKPGTGTSVGASGRPCRARTTSHTRNAKTLFENVPFSSPPAANLRGMAKPPRRPSTLPTARTSPFAAPRRRADWRLAYGRLCPISADAADGTPVSCIACTTGSPVLQSTSGRAFESSLSERHSPGGIVASNGVESHSRILGTSAGTISFAVVARVAGRVAALLRIVP